MSFALNKLVQPVPHIELRAAWQLHDTHHICQLGASTCDCCPTDAQVPNVSNSLPQAWVELANLNRYHPGQSEWGLVCRFWRVNNVQQARNSAHRLTCPCQDPPVRSSKKSCASFGWRQGTCWRHSVLLLCWRFSGHSIQVDLLVEVVSILVSSGTACCVTNPWFFVLVEVEFWIGCVYACWLWGKTVAWGPDKWRRRWRATWRWWIFLTCFDSLLCVFCLDALSKLSAVLGDPRAQNTFAWPRGLFYVALELWIQ